MPEKFNADCDDCRCDLGHVEQLAKDLIRDAQPAPRAWRVLYLEHVPMLLAEIERLRDAD